MARTRLLAIPILAALTLVISALPGRAAGTYQTTITMHLSPSLNQFTSTDIAFVDSSTSTLATTDRNNKSLDVWDTNENRFIRASDPVFVGINAVRAKGGPNGVYIISNGDRDDHGDHERNTTPYAGLEDGAHANLSDVGNLLVEQDRDNHDRGNGWAGDGDGSVKVIDLNNGHQVNGAAGTIPTGGSTRADELWYSPEDREIMIGVPDQPAPMGPFEAFISTAGTPRPNSLKAQLIYDGAGGSCTPGTVGSVSITVCHTPTGDKATNGLEQPIATRGHSDRDDDRDDEHGRFWLAVPGSAATTSPPAPAVVGRIDEINPDTFQVVHSIPMPQCGPTGPTGLSLVNDHEAVAACPSGVEFVKLSTLSPDGAPIAGTGGADQIWYNPGDGNTYVPTSVRPPATQMGCADEGLTVDTTAAFPATTTANPQAGQLGPCVAVVHGVGGSASVIAKVLLPADAGTHNVSADSRNNEVFVPVYDLDCTTGTCPPTTSITPCPIAVAQGGCVHDQGVAVIQLGP